MAHATFSLREATAADSEFLTDMLLAATNWDPDRVDISRDHLLADRATSRYIDGWPRRGDLGLVALQSGDQPVGAAWIRLFGTDDRGYGFIAPDVPELSIGVLADWRGRGVGRTLLRALTERAAAAGLRQVSLSVERTNYAARLYAREGFVTVESGKDADTMVLGLSDTHPSA